MAEATLNDVIARLRSDNEKQVREQRDTTEAVNSLTKTIKVLMVLMELQILKNQEAEAEKERKKSAAKSKKSSDSGSFLGLNIPTPLLLLGRTLGNIAAFASGLILATEGLGPSLRDFRLFTRTIIRIFTFPARFTADLGRAFGGGSLSNYIRNQVTRLDNFFSRRYSFNEAAGRFQRLASRFGGGTGFVPAREVSRYQKMLISINRIFTRISRMFNAIRIPQGLITRLSKTQDVLMRVLGMGAGAVRGIANSRLITGIFRFLRPLAAILSMIDGFRNASAEMEDREGLFNTWLGGGVGGFVSGTLGSFFGEFANLLRDIPLWLVKQFVPAEWLNSDGTFKSTEEGGNWFTSMLRGVETIDFNGLITRIFQYPFNILGNTLDFFRNLFGAEGTTEEGQSQARAAWNQWWSNFSSVGGTLSNIGDVFSYMANIAFSPLNAILHEIETAFFGADPNRGEETFSERVGRYLSNIRTYIFQWLAELIGPGRLATFLGLDQYLQSDANQEERINSATARLSELQSQRASIMSRFDLNRDGIIDANEDPENMVAGQLAELRAEANEARLVAQEALAGLRSNGTIGEQVINNYQNVIDNWNIAMPPTTDGNDPLLVR